MLPMAGCKQDPEHHAEGDVLVHTKSVCEALVQLKSWQELDVEAKCILFAACLLHDVAKPACTKIDEKGHISSLKHTRVGVSMAREILWRSSEFNSPPFHLREQIAKLVRFSGLPIWFMEKEDPVKAVLRASMSVRMDWLSILAEADVNGRICKDKNELMNRVHMFKDFCDENKCLTQPREFASAHSRFSYFHSESKQPDRDVFDDNESTVTLMSGLPGSGKDRWINQNVANVPLISLDAIRTQLDVDPEDNQGPVVANAKQQAREYLRKGEDFVWNATNISSSLRSSLITSMQTYRAKIRIVYVEAPSFNVLKERNRSRNNPVLEAVLQKLLSRLEVPELSEAHDLSFCIE